MPLAKIRKLKTHYYFVEAIWLDVKRCHSCDVEMQFAGKAPFRIGGTSGRWKLLFGEWAELEKCFHFTFTYVQSAEELSYSQMKKQGDVYYSIQSLKKT
jgi:hypothetical protein